MTTTPFRPSSLETTYCQRESCTPAEFRRTAFWHSLPWHARRLAPFFGGYKGDHFAPDRELIDAAARAATMQQVREEIHDFYLDSANLRWTRRVAHVRISTQRFKDHVRPYLPKSTNSTPPI